MYIIVSLHFHCFYFFCLFSTVVFGASLYPSFSPLGRHTLSEKATVLRILLQYSILTLIFKPCEEKRLKKILLFCFFVMFSNFLPLFLSFFVATSEYLIAVQMTNTRGSIVDGYNLCPLIATETSSGGADDTINGTGQTNEIISHHEGCQWPNALQVRKGSMYYFSFRFIIYIVCLRNDFYIFFGVELAVKRYYHDLDVCHRFILTAVLIRINLEDLKLRFSLNEVKCVESG